MEINFYTEAELIKIYDVSSITVVRALNDLAADGYIVRQQGKGTFVSRARKHKLVEFSDVETFPIQKAKVKVLSIKRGNTLSILDKLGLNPTQFYYKIERTRHTGDDTYIFHQTYVPDNTSIQTIQIWNTTALSMIASKKTTTFI